jgi:diguanylate cyclase (GGDEF)-like protein/PAS domain S-box-containing protein
MIYVDEESLWAAIEPDSGVTPESFYREALSAAGVGTWRLDMVTGLTTWDEVTARLFGYPEQVREAEAMLPVHPEDRDTAAAAIDCSFTTGDPCDIEFRVLRPSGEVRWMRGMARPRAAEPGQRRWLCGIVFDIHDCKVSELGLRDSQRQLSTLIDNLPGFAYRCGTTPPWRLDYASDGALEVTGYPAQAWLSGEIAWADVVYPEDLPALEAEVAEAIAGRRRFDLTYRIRHRDGSIRWLHERGQAIFDGGGEALFAEGFIGDVTDRKRAEEALLEAKERAHSILDSVPQIVWACGADGRCDYLSPQWREFTGRDPQADLANGWTAALHQDDRDGTRLAWTRSLVDSTTFETEFRLKHRGGGYRWALARALPERDAAGKVVRWYGTCTDIHEGVMAKRALTESEALNRSILDSSPDCIKLVDRDSRILFVNRLGPRAMDMEDGAAMIGARWLDLLEPSSAAEAANALEKAAAGETAHFTMMQPTANGLPKWWDVVATPVDTEGGAERLAVIARDVTRQKQSEERVRWIANHDPLTGLPNRLLFQERLDEISAGGGGNGGGGFALLLLDVDDFKRVNDSLGHDAGDALLCAFGERLRAATRADDFVARLGGDEFAVILNGVTCADEVASAGHAILHALREPHIHAGRILDCNASIGASLFPSHGKGRTELLKHADIALYVAKASWRGNLRIFDGDMRSEMQNRMSMLGVARQALRDDLIVPFYQPKIDLVSGEVAGFEALLRWRHHRRGIQKPDTIAAAFEDLSTAAAISDRMVEKVIADMRGWLDRGLAFGHVAINSAAAEFRKGDFAERLLERLHQANIPAERLQLEVTETVFLGRGADYVERALKTLSQAGVQIALDDFGTGYASLSHLKQFPVDVLKIDRSFVAELGENADAAAIIRAVINLGHSLEIEVVAEGIETAHQATRLTNKGCRYGQGHLYSPAVRAAEVPGLIARFARARAA